MADQSSMPGKEDEDYQVRILKGVSRTFALTIPQLPGPLFRVVSNAYLLCRIADTIEDDRDMPLRQKRELSDLFIEVVAGGAMARAFSSRLLSLLSARASADERDLVAHTPSVVRITHSFNRRQRAALERCIRIMAHGMYRFQEVNLGVGLQTQKDLDDYCYHVAGVVGELLTELFCDYSPDIDRHQAGLMPLAVSFGQGLQMTNILKDFWEDRARNACWLPREVCLAYGADLDKVSPAGGGPAFQLALGHMLGTARAHLADALRYTLMIPPHETGIRRFCLWALGMAALTLRNINHHREFTSARQVKISRASVRRVILLSNLLTRRDRLLKGWFYLMTKTLPYVERDKDLELATENTENTEN
jgi:farnesyl-diphosphate farnesyltransferase